MFMVGVLLVLAGGLVIVAAVFGSEGSATLLDRDLNALTIFLLGLGSGVAVWWGYAIARLGLRRSLRHRRESKELQELSEKLDKADEQRRRDVDDDPPKI